MAQKTLAQLNTAILAILEDNGTIFSDTTTALNESLKTLSRYSPWRSARILAARDKSRDIDVSNLDLVDVDYAVYPVALKASGVWLDDTDLDDNRRNVEWDTDSVRMDIEDVPTAETTDTLTGTVTFTAASTAIIGSSTLFTSELRVGYYIQKSTGSTWYRIGSITSDTALVLSKTVVTADDGADAASATKFWQSDVYLKCGEIHYLTTQTDFAGAIDAGVAGGYAAGVWSIHVDALTNGTIYKNTLFTIAGCDGLYRVTEDATIASSEGTLSIEPSLREIAPENAVVTFKPSSLKPQEERLLTELAAANLAINHVGDGRTQIAAGITALADVNTSTDNMTAAIGRAVVDIASVRTNLGTMLGALLTTPLGEAEIELDLAKTDIADARTAFKTAGDLTAIGNAVDAIAARITQALSDIATARPLVNTITYGANVPANDINLARAELQAAVAKVNEARAYMQKGSNQANQLYNAANHEVNLASGYSAEARTLLSQYSIDVSNLGAAASRELGVAAEHLSQAHGYTSEINTRLSVANIIASYSKWGQNKLQKIEQELRALSTPRIFHSYSRS